MDDRASPSVIISIISVTREPRSSSVMAIKTRNKSAGSRQPGGWRRSALWIVLDFTTLGLLSSAVRRATSPALQRKLLSLSAILLLLIGIFGFAHAVAALWRAF